MLKIYLKDGALVLEEPNKPTIAVVQNPRPSAVGNFVKFNFNAAGITKMDKYHYVDIEVDGTVRGSAEETIGEINKLCAVFKQGGGVTPPTPPQAGWRPQPDWWDIEKILCEDTDPNLRAIFLIPDTEDKTTLYGEFESMQYSGNAESTFKASDGGTPIKDVPYEWDKTKDKPCSLGYKTRWIKMYSTNKNIYFGYTSPYIFTIFKNCNLFLYIGQSVLECTKLIDVTTNGTSLSFQNSNSMVYAPEFPVGVKISASNTFSGCRSLKHVKVQNSMSFSATTFSNCESLLTIDCDEGTVLSSNLTLTTSSNLSLSSLRTFAQKLGTTSTARTIYLHANVKNRLTPADIAVFTAKGYTIM